MASRNQTRLLAEGDIDIGEELESLEQVIERCKVLYEQYFMGIQKVAPETLHRQIERRLLKLTQTKIRNTGLRFRFTTLSQKFGAYNTYWRRTMRAIEQGRYVPHLAAAARRAQREGKDMPDELIAKMPKRLRERLLHDREVVRQRAEREAARRARDDKARKTREARPHQHRIDPADVGAVDFEALFDAIQDGGDARPEPEQPAAKAKPAPAPAPPAAAPPPVPKPAAAPAQPPRPPSVPPRPQSAPRAAAAALRDSQGNALPPGMTERQTRELLDKFVKARQLVGGNTDNVTYAKLLRTLNKQAPQIMKQHGARAVEFDVVIKDDRVVLKAKPKK